MDKKNIAPIAAAMQKYSADGALAFHTPGHKQGLGSHELLKKLITAEGLRQEVSLMEELDDLHSPRTCIKDAENLAAKLFNADDALFIINGTTCAIQTMILATLKAGDLVFVPRNSHRSVMAGLILAGAIPIFLPVESPPTLTTSSPVTFKASPLTVKPPVKSASKLAPLRLAKPVKLEPLPTTA